MNNISNWEKFDFFMKNTADLLKEKTLYKEVYIMGIKEESDDFKDFYFKLWDALGNWVDKYYSKLMTMYNSIPGVTGPEDLKTFLMRTILNRFVIIGFKSEAIIKEKFEKLGWKVDKASAIMDLAGIDLIIEKDYVKFFVQVKTTDYEVEKDIIKYTPKNVDLLAYASNKRIIALSQKAKKYFIKK